MRNIAFVVSLIVIAAAPVASRAVDLTQVAKLTEPSPSTPDEFGFAVAVANGEALITARSDGSGTTRPGWVRTWTAAGSLWTRFGRFEAADGATTQRFGESISLSGAYAVVGTPRDNDFGEISGSAYVFLRDATSWSQQAKLHASTPAAFDEYGIAVAIDGDYAIVGSRSDDDGGSQSGSAYLYLRSGTSWPQQQKLIALDDATKDYFGSAVSIHGSYALIGAPGDDTNIGSAYVFLRSGTSWAQQAKLTANDRAGGDVMGTAVALRGDYAAAGAPGDDTSRGAVYIYKRTGSAWAQTAKITLTGAAANDQFGASVAMRGDQLLVGAPGRSGNRGAAYLYERSEANWIQLAHYTASDAAAGHRLGASVAFDADYAVAGAPGASAGGGAAYVFNTVTLDCNANGVPDACDTSCLPTNPVTGVSCLALSPSVCGVHPDCNFNTIPDECETDCDTNGVPDACDIANGADDCNTNGVPDVCESDCNGNGVADDCDVISEFSPDCNADGVPDECQLLSDEVLTAADFNAGAWPPGWSATGLWNVTDQCASGVPCDAPSWAYFGLSGACNFDTGSVVTGTLTSAPVALPSAVTSVRLNYCSNYDGDRGLAPNGFDAAWVTVNGEILDDVGGTVTARFWETRTVDLTAFAGQTVTVAWHFDSNDTTLNNRLGWQIDAIEVVADGDCNANGVLDACDVASGEVADCNSNGVPDSCDLDGGGSEDCNSNNLPDECEDDSDCNFNGVLDFCEPVTLLVDADATGASDGSSWSDAYDDLQDALAHAQAECVPVEIWVADGVYAPGPLGGARTATFALANKVALYGGFSGTESALAQRNPDPLTNATVLSGDLDGLGPADNSYHVVTAVSTDASALLDGFTIRDGIANAANPHDRGSALVMSQASPTISNCVFANCSATAGAVAISGGTPKFTRCTAIANTAKFGGGFYIEGASTPVFEACRVLGNTSTAGGGGGGMFITAASLPRLGNCLFSGNIAADYGGALYVQSSSKPTLTNCTLNRNAALIAGGGVYASISSVVTSWNSILWENHDPGGFGQSAQIGGVNSTFTVNYSCIQGLTGSLGGIGNISANPAFADANGLDNVFGTIDDDTQLAPGSPCIDAGNNAPVTQATDLAGLLRRNDDTDTADTGVGTPPIVDIGAYEFQSDCNRNGVADSVDLAVGNSSDCNLNAVPDECEISSNGAAQGGPYFCASVCDPDCNYNGVPDACDVAGGTSDDCADDGVPDECEADCNSNGVVDSCDLMVEADVDCNANGVPDGCELLAGDCDENGVLDVCDLENPYVTVVPGLLTPVDGHTMLSFVVPSVRPAISNVVLTFLARGDFSATTEYLDVFINGANVGVVFDTSAGDCPTLPNQDQIVLTAEQYNALLTGGDAVVEMVPSDEVDILVGCDSYIAPALQYQAYSDCNANGIPDACEDDCNANGVADGCDITSGFSLDCNANGSPDDCDLAEGTSADDNSNAIPDDCELDCNANNVPDECDVSCANTIVAGGALCLAAFPAECGLAEDCDADGVPDECAGDCDADGVPDGCAIAAGSAPDCNANGSPDECDLADQVSSDCDADGVPDECAPDIDSDGVIDACDGCSLDPAKTAPGACGCGSADTDSDADGVPNCDDLCPGTAAGQSVDADGCPYVGACCLGLNQCIAPLDRATCEDGPPNGLLGTYQGNGSTCATDWDHDGFPNCDDACRNDPGKIDPGDCGCGVPDIDGDADFVADCLDLCPQTAPGAAVDEVGCHLYGACCNGAGTCIHNTFVTEQWCLAQSGWTYQGNGSTCALQCAPRGIGDYDADGDFDAQDFAVYAQCAGMPYQAASFLPPSALCQLVFDVNFDGDVDLLDFGMLQDYMTH